MQMQAGCGLECLRRSITRLHRVSYRPHSTRGSILVLELFSPFSWRPADQITPLLYSQRFHVHLLDTVYQPLLRLCLC